MPPARAADREPRYFPRPGLSPGVAMLVAAGLLRPRDRILEVGCGTGSDALALACIGFRRVAGIDISRRSIAQARARARRAKVDVRFEIGDATRLQAFPPASFDAVVDTLMSNNLREAGLRRYAGEAARVLRPEGLLVMQTKVLARGQPPRLPVAFRRRFSFGPAVRTTLPQHPIGSRWVDVAAYVGRRKTAR
ncbi:MAG TPA: class I SAM-dependent methyltransferase [Candidatus Thermoplasmatota archaeon]|nr:class I SAM-dependent methyltransferase [Candidatus Thermoplasmatota archaeon]